jgi:hypothetical protein
MYLRKAPQKGRMFWGCFSGASGEGPGLFWEKNWGMISEATYREHTVPLIHEWIQANKRSNIELYFMQDGAPGHRAAGTQADVRERGIRVIFWPPFPLI